MAITNAIAEAYRFEDSLPEDAEVEYMSSKDKGSKFGGVPTEAEEVDHFDENKMLPP